MKTPLTRKTAAYIVATLLVAYPLTFSAASSQTASPARHQQVPVKGTESPILARNTGTKTSETASKTDKLETVATESGKKVQDKKTIGRCWQRLMNMAREVNHTHRAKRRAVQ